MISSTVKIYQVNALYYLLAGFSFDLEETRVSICKISEIYILDRSFLKTFHLRCSLKRINTQYNMKIEIYFLLKIKVKFVLGVRK
jgi:hypothetical protein